MHEYQGEDCTNREKDSTEIPFPSFEELVALAKENPFEFEALRIQLCSQVIGEAPEQLQQRLQGLQFTIDMERKRHGSSYLACLKISQMMNESLVDLSKALSNPQEYQRERERENERCDIVPLFS